MVCNEEKIVSVVLAKVKTCSLCDFAALVANFTHIIPAMFKLCRLQMEWWESHDYNHSIYMPRELSYVLC